MSFLKRTYTQSAFDKNHEEIMYFFMRQTESQLNRILKKLNKIGKQMATLEELYAASKQQQDIIQAALAQTNMLIVEIKQLLAQKDIPGAQALLDTITANNQLIVASAAEQADLTRAVDAVNGDPVV